MVLEKETFGACKNLTRIEIPESLKYIESGAFRESGLQEVVFHGTPNKVSWNAFWGCENLVAVSADGERISKEVFL